MTITASPGPRDARQAINGDGAFASCDQQDLFDLVSMLGDRFTAGKDVDQDSHGVEPPARSTRCCSVGSPGPRTSSRAVAAARRWTSRLPEWPGLCVRPVRLRTARAAPPGRGRSPPAGREMTTTREPSISMMSAPARWAIERTTSAPAALSPAATTDHDGSLFPAGGPWKPSWVPWSVRRAPSRMRLQVQSRPRPCQVLEDMSTSWMAVAIWPTSAACTIPWRPGTVGRLDRLGTVRLSRRQGRTRRPRRGQVQRPGVSRAIRTWPLHRGTSGFCLGHREDRYRSSGGAVEDAGSVNRSPLEPLPQPVPEKALLVVMTG